MSGPSSKATTARLDRPIPLEGVHPVPDWPWAQERTNFVIVGPRADSAWKIEEATVRGESAQAYSTVRYFLTRGDRRLRVKQYFHDWWIPTVVDISFRRPGHPITYGESVAYAGRDYRRHEASCGHVWGTGVEMSLEGGAMIDPDWAAVWAELDAVVAQAVRQARDSCFAARSYWNRWKRTEAPWDSREISSLEWHPPTTAAMERAAWALTADRWMGVPGVIDSIGFAPGEAQLVFRRPLDLNVSAWLRAIADPRPSWRPLLDASEVNRPNWTPTEVEGTPVERASMDPTVGNWYFAWRTGPVAYELHLRAHRGLDVAAATRVAKGLVAYLDSAALIR